MLHGPSTEIADRLGPLAVGEIGRKFNSRNGLLKRRRPAGREEPAECRILRDKNENWRSAAAWKETPKTKGRIYADFLSREDLGELREVLASHVSLALPRS